jgi:hypothetical protein
MLRCLSFASPLVGEDSKPARGGADRLGALDEGYSMTVSTSQYPPHFTNSTSGDFHLPDSNSGFGR